jgi:outer membrane protein assembly factor BamB
VGLIAATGKIVWQYPWKTSYNANIGDPIVSGDTVFVSSGYNKGCGLFRIGANNLAEIWQNKNMRNHFNSSVLWQGYVYGFDDAPELRCLDFQTGQIKWSQARLGKGSLMIADGKLIILSEKGKLVIAKASPDKFEELASSQILKGKCWTVPVLANGRIYARNADGQLVCVDVSSKG